jgi:hypothetical protein
MRIVAGGRGGGVVVVVVVRGGVRMRMGMEGGGRVSYAGRGGEV